jgi:uncharacterized protein (DUF433 family)
MAHDTPQPSASAASNHIEVTPDTCGGKPRIAGHRIRVQDVVIWNEQGQSVDEIVAAFPQLSLAEVYSALAYYHDHREQIDRDIREDEEFFEQLRTREQIGFLDLPRTTNLDGGNPIPS